ncbi:response regulator [Achromobacter insuavis]
MRQALESEGCAVFEADTVKRGLIEAGTRQPDAVVLDLGLPDEDGMTLIRELRGWTEVPVLVLSARTAEADKVAALDAGADDYLTKPFGVSELLARLRVLLRPCPRRRRQRRRDQLRRRARGLRQARGRTRRPARTPDRHGIPPAGRAAGPSRQSHDPPRTAARGLYSSHVESNHYLRIYMGHLRQKLEADPAQPVYLLTEIGVGYRFAG